MVWGGNACHSTYIRGQLTFICFSHVDPKGQTQVVRLDSKCPTCQAISLTPILYTLIIGFWKLDNIQILFLSPYLFVHFLIKISE